jgi:hypothetical protein
MTMKTPFVRLEPGEFLDGFDPDAPPDPEGYWDPDTMAPNAEWDELRTRWAMVKSYVNFHGARCIPSLYANAYEMPELAKKWADEIILGGQPLPLVLYGGIGVGKTHGACAVAAYLGAFWSRQIYNDIPAVVFAQASRLVSELKSFSNGEKREGRLLEVTCAKVLIIDDLTRFQPTDFDMETLGQILDDRSGASLPTVITVNEEFTDKLEDKVPPFLASRLQAGQMVGVFGPDHRRE